MDHRMGTPEEEKYEAGKIYDLPPQSVARWQKRGLVVEPTPEEVAAFEGSKRLERPRRVQTPTSSTPATTPATSAVPSKKATVTAQPPPPTTPAIPATPATTPVPMERSKLNVVLRSEDLMPPTPEPAPAPAPAPEPAPAPVPTNVAEVTIPKDYESLAWPKLKNLAMRVGGAPVNDRDAALAVLAAEVAKRAG